MSGEDVEMKENITREIVCGAPALNYKRDHMKIEPLY